MTTDVLRAVVFVLCAHKDVAIIVETVSTAAERFVVLSPFTRNVSYTVVDSVVDRYPAVPRPITVD